MRKTSNKTWMLSILFLLLWIVPALAQNQQVQELIAKHPKTDFAIFICQADSGRTILDIQGNKPMIPASNMKIITSATAIDVLGTDFIFETKTGLLLNNLAIIGSGDPLIGDPDLAEEKSRDPMQIFQDIQKSLQQQEISVISGDLLIDNFLFDDQRYHPSWSPAESNKSYAAQVSALNFYNNCIDFTLKPSGSAGAAVRYWLFPDTTYVTVTNRGKTILRGTQTAWASRDLNTNQITLRGSTKFEHVMTVAIERPGAYFGHILAEHLLAHDMRISGQLKIIGICDAQRNPPAEFKVLSTYQTPIAEVLIRSNRDSENMVAECLFKTAGAHYMLNNGTKPGQGSWQSGREATAAFLTKLGVNPSQFNIDDGSGLSRKNQVSPKCLAAVLRHMHQHAGVTLFRESLATPFSGTLKNNRRFRESQYRDRIFAKSGYINKVWALSGYARRSDGVWLVFSIIANDGSPSPMKTIDQIVKLMIK
ncbi:MAG: D-alanyl-D-alanine carboxypeptidase/D-alanyl-D-alanine-endopeptidase [Planctomycetes bacterium]|nr:D-alanyl-D-alanine carboxypeptidase/D-alanyl-D-alanine-endopeptidase [Planctomycetota bacterium]